MLFLIQGIIFAVAMGGGWKKSDFSISNVPFLIGYISLPISLLLWANYLKAFNKHIMKRALVSSSISLIFTGYLVSHEIILRAYGI